mgnify:CR=1 FL=1
MEAMKDDNCIFCKLANGDIPTRSIYEDDTFRVFLDVAPATKGHALIVPKDHAANLYELPEETAGKALILAKKMAAHMTEKLGCDGFNVVQNNGEIAGQTVFHFHMHLIPRYKGDANMDRFVWNPTSPSDAELDAVQTALKLD